MVLAPISATGIDRQGILANIVTLLHDFWTIMMPGFDLYLALQVTSRQIIVIRWVNTIFRLGSVWFSRPYREIPDPHKQSCFFVVYHTVYVPLVDPVIDDMQDFCWRLILSIWRIAK